jgi:hypothetical protein
LQEKYVKASFMTKYNAFQDEKRKIQLLKLQYHVVQIQIVSLDNISISSVSVFVFVDLMQSSTIVEYPIRIK